MLCSIAGLQAAGAQPPATSPPPPPAASAAPPAASPPAVAGPVAADARSDAGWQLYHDAFAALMQGERARASELASALLRTHPEHPATRLVRSAPLGLAPGGLGEPLEAPGGGGEGPSRNARAELALFQGLHGMALGVELCIVAQCDSAGAVFGLALLGAGLGTFASLGVPEVTSGKRALLNSGTAWGAVNAGLLLVGRDVDEETFAGVLMAGQGIGLAVGGGLFRIEPTAGQVALANSGGQWAGVLTALTLDAAGAELGDSELATSVLIAADAGIVAGGYLASRWPRVSRAQTLVVDAAGIAGVVGGGGLGIVLSGDSADRATSAFAAVGGLVGLGAAAYLTRDWTSSSGGALQTYVLPAERGRGGVAGLRFDW
jgi:hypothetical protein